MNAHKSWIHCFHFRFVFFQILKQHYNMICEYAVSQNKKQREYVYHQSTHPPAIHSDYSLRSDPLYTCFTVLCNNFALQMYCCFIHNMQFSLHIQPTNPLIRCKGMSVFFKERYVLFQVSESVYNSFPIVNQFAVSLFKSKFVLK